MGTVLLKKQPLHYALVSQCWKLENEQLFVFCALALVWGPSHPPGLVCCSPHLTGLRFLGLPGAVSYGMLPFTLITKCCLFSMLCIIRLALGKFLIWVSQLLFSGGEGEQHVSLCCIILNLRDTDKSNLIFVLLPWHSDKSRIYLAWQLIDLWSIH